MSSCTPTVTRGLLIALSIITPCLRTVEFMWLLQHSPSRENYLFVCSCIKCVSQTDELDVTSEEEEEDEGEAEGETEGDEAEDEMTDVWWKTFPLRLFPFPTPHCKQQPKPRRINNRARCGKTLSVCFTGRWFWFSDRRTSEEVKGCGFCTRQQINGRTTWSVFPWWWNHVFKLLFFFSKCFTFTGFCFMFHLQNSNSWRRPSTFLVPFMLNVIQGQNVPARCFPVCLTLCSSQKKIGSSFHNEK